MSFFLIFDVFIPYALCQISGATAVKIGYSFLNKLGCLRVIENVGGLDKTYFIHFTDTADDIGTFVASEDCSAFLSHICLLSR